MRSGRSADSQHEGRENRHEGDHGADRPTELVPRFLPISLALSSVIPPIGLAQIDQPIESRIETERLARLETWAGLTASDE